MNFFVSSGIVSYQLNIGLMTWILGLLYKRKLYKEKPLFSAFVIARLVRSLVLFPLLLEYGLETYSRAYWLTDPLILAVELLAVAELIGLSKWTYLVASLVSGYQLYLGIMRDDRAMSVEFAVSVVVAVATIPLIYKSLVALGFFATSLVTALTMTNGFLFKADTARYLPTYIFVIANFLWVGALLKTTSSRQKAEGC